MRHVRNIWQGVLILLFMGFVVSMVFGTSRNQVAEMMQQAVAVDHS